MLAALASCGALFFSMTVMLVAHSLLGSLVAIQLGKAGYDSGTVGLVMAGYFLGIVGGSLLSIRLIQRVGHVRVFAAMAATTSLCVMAHTLVVDPFVWALLRVVSGISITAMYVVIESWINDRADNSFRGGLTAVYLVLFMLAMFGGQQLLTVGEGAGTGLFLVAAAFLTAAIVPLTLSAAPSPNVETPRRISIVELFRRAPLGVISAGLIGLMHGVLLAMIAVYGSTVGLDTDGIAILAGGIYLGGMVLTYPVGRLSDFMERRLVMAIVCMAVSALCIVTMLIGASSFWLLVILMAVLGGLSQPLYSLCLAITNDRLESHERVGASATLYLSIGLASVPGPIIAGALMDIFGGAGFLLYLAVLHASLGAYALYRMTKRAAPEEQGDLLAAPMTLPPFEAGAESEDEEAAAAEPGGSSTAETAMRSYTYFQESAAEEEPEPSEASGPYSRDRE